MALGVWVFFRLSNNEAELDAGIEVVLTSGFCVLTSATRHRLHIPFPIDKGIRYQESGIRFGSGPGPLMPDP
jgi:hypothetical protein